LAGAKIIEISLPDSKSGRQSMLVPIVISFALQMSPLDYGN